MSIVVEGLASRVASTLFEMEATDSVSMCQLEVRADVVPESLALVGDSRYRFHLQPTLDEADRRQLVGCLQDIRIDHALANVVSIDDVAKAEAMSDER